MEKDEKEDQEMKEEKEEKKKEEEEGEDEEKEGGGERRKRRERGRSRKKTTTSTITTRLTRKFKSGWRSGTNLIMFKSSRWSFSHHSLGLDLGRPRPRTAGTDAI